MQITIYEIADSWSEEEILKYRRKLIQEIEIFNEAMKLKKERLNKIIIQCGELDKS